MSAVPIPSLDLASSSAAAGGKTGAQLQPNFFANSAITVAGNSTGGGFLNAATVITALVIGAVLWMKRRKKSQ